MAQQVHEHGQIPAAIGGEHLLTLPLVRAANERFPDLVILQFDAHMDLRNNYLGVELSHACVMRRICEFIDPSRILQVGQRSGTREEFQLAETFGNPRSTDLPVDSLKQWVGNRPLYVTVDLDILDPSVLPGTGTPEPGGVSFSQLQSWIAGLATCKWVGWDVVELAPNLDPSSVSSVVSAKIVRTMLLASTAMPC
jgi:agmatinase